MTRRLDENGREIMANRQAISATHKECSVCLGWVPKERFYKDGGKSTSGLSSACRDCEIKRRHRRDAKAFADLVAKMGGGCHDCAERDEIVLGLHPCTDKGVAMKKKGNTDRRDPVTARMLLQIRDHRKHFVILCANCNLRRRHKEGRLPGRR